MEEEEINHRLTNEYNNEFSESQDYFNKREKSEFITFQHDENNTSNDNDKYIYNPSNEISPIKISETVNTRPFHSIENFRQNRFTNYNPYTYNHINKNNYSNNSMPINMICNDNNDFIRKTYVNRTQDFSPYFHNNKIKYKKYNKLQLYKDNTTDEGESYINQNRDSTFYKNNNSANQTQNMYMTTPAEFPLEQQLNSKDNSEDEQLIIYPEKKYIFVDEKYFSKKNNEGILKPKNLETYEIRSIEYIPDEEHQYKSISLGDYILRGNKKKIRKTKSCNNIYHKKEDNEIEYEIKLFQKNKKDTKTKNNLVSSDILYNIKTLKDKMNKSKDNIKSINNISIIKKEKEKNKINDESDYNKGGIIDLSDKKKYENKFIKIKYPKWKILASACLIQSWFRSLKRLKLLYKKNLHKIIIIQKVYKLHYKNKILSNRQKPTIYKNYIKEAKDDYNNINIYRAKKPKKYFGKYNKQALPKYQKNIPIIYNSSSEDYNYRNNKINNKSNKSNITNINKVYELYNEQKQKIRKNETNLIQNYISRNNNMINIGILLIEKILENKILKIYFNFMYNLKNYRHNKIKNDKETDNNIKLKLDMISLEKKNNHVNLVQSNYINKNIKPKNESKNNNIIKLNNKKNYIDSPNLKEKNLLKKIFLSIWFKKSVRLNNSKNMKKSKFINCFNTINNRNKQNLKYAFKKIKKFAKVRFNVLNNYASIIQNAFRYYMENKQKRKII